MKPNPKTTLVTILDWWDGLPPDVRAKIESAGEWPGWIEAARKLTGSVPSDRHSWGEPDRSIVNPDTGNDETHRACKRCPIIAITVHPPQGLPWPEWQLACGDRVQSKKTPKCKPEGS